MKDALEHWCAVVLMTDAPLASMLVVVLATFSEIAFGLTVVSLLVRQLKSWLT
jgi:hypothetical protein